MIIKITKEHILLGKPVFNKCPLSLACQEEFDLPARCMEISPKILTLIQYNGAISYTIKWPYEAERFYEQYFNHFELADQFNPLPKPCEFDIGVLSFYAGYSDDIVRRSVFNIHNWYGDLEYED